LAVITEHYWYDLTAVPVTCCLQLKSAVTYLGRNTLLGNREWFHSKRFEGLDWVDVDPAEPHASNALAIGESVIFPASFPKTRARLEAKGFHVESLDISELQKAESGLTCSSLLFDAACIINEATFAFQNQRQVGRSHSTTDLSTCGYRVWI